MARAANLGKGRPPSSQERKRKQAKKEEEEDLEKPEEGRRQGKSTTTTTMRKQQEPHTTKKSPARTQQEPRHPKQTNRTANIKTTTSGSKVNRGSKGAAATAARARKGKSAGSSSPSEEESSSSSDGKEEEIVPNRKRAAEKAKKADDSSTSSEEEEEEEEENSSDDSDDGSEEPEDAEDSNDEDIDDREDEEADMPAFSDQNASWLKPKKAKQEGKKASLLESDDDDDEDESERSSDHDDDQEDDNDLLDIEKEARIMDQENEEELMEADDEMRHTIRHHTSVYHLPTQQELDRNVDRVVPPSELKGHIESILEVLTEFRDRREPGRSRKEYIDVLGTFLAELHGYLPELIQYYLTMLGPAETVEFVAQSDKPRPLVIRTNTLKTRRKDLAAALMKRGVTLDPLASWSKVGLVIAESPVPIGATPEYLSGHYMLQSAASMCAVVALSPQPNDKVLDVSSAPGGKTTYLSQLMRNTGVVVANDLKSERQKATVANVHRLGVRNVVACQHDGRKLGALFRNRFDRVLLDAPCSGLGVASRDPSVKVQRTLADVHKCAHLQKELLLSAIDALKFKGTSGGYMVYSTCSVSVAENEEVVQYALAKRDIKIVDTGLEVGRPGYTRFQEKRFHPSMALTRRFYPHVHNMDGFFVAKIQKLSDGRPGVNPSAQGEEDATLNDAVADDGDASGEKTDVKAPRGATSAQTKKRKQQPGGDKAESGLPKKSKNPLVSVPPPRPKAAKPKKQNAKVSKPRRSRAATDA